MKPRAQAVKFILEQLDGKRESAGKRAWHYGRCELRDALDFIYGGPPKSPPECLGEPLKLRNAKVGKWR